MALFYVSSNNNTAISVEKDYNRLFGNANKITVGDNLYFVSTNGFSRKNIIHKKYSDAEVFIEGTIFGEHGFNDKWIDGLSSVQKLRETLLSDIVLAYGHFIIIILYFDSTYEIITDKIGSLNVYYSCNKPYDVSNDIVEIGKMRDDNIVSSQVVSEFMVSESNVNQDTILKNIRRLSFGNELILTDEILKEIPCFTYKIYPTTESDYYKQIEKYFNLISNYEGNIGVDISAGFDTRTVLAAATGKFKIKRLFTNKRMADEFVDFEISKEVAEKLNIPLSVFERDNAKAEKNDAELIAHITAGLRNCIRSDVWIKMFCMRYSDCDMSLGGYGGEAIRGKYNKYKSEAGVAQSIERFSREYYEGDKVEKWNISSGYSDTVAEKLNKYWISEEISKKNRECNWLYLVDKMRIWGSAFLQTSMMFGDTLHPFMDWALIAPLFGLDSTVDFSCDFQKKVISYFCAEIGDYPINKHITVYKRNKTLFNSSKLIDLVKRLIDFWIEKKELKSEMSSCKIINDELKRSIWSARYKFRRINIQRVRSIIYCLNLMK